MSKSDHDTYKQASHTIPATSIASVSVTVPRFVRIIRISSLARHLLSADFYLGITRGVRLRVGGKGLSMLGVSRAGVRFCTGASPRRYAITWSAALRPSQSCWRITLPRRASSKRLCKPQLHLGNEFDLLSGGSKMSKVVCVLYEDPIDGYPKSYVRDDLPKLTRYPDGQTLPIQKR